MPVLDEKQIRPLVRDHQRECGRRIQGRRQLLGLSQSELAELAGVTQPTISHIEIGQKTPRDHVKIMIAAALSCSVGDLWPHPDRERIAALLRDLGGAA